MSDTNTVEMVECKVWVIVDEDGNYIADASPDDASQRYVDEIGSEDSVAKRVVAVTIRVPKPRPITVTVEVPDEPQTATVAVS